MSDFTLDTSGAIHIPGVPLSSISPRMIWSDLDPFTQGYVEALFASLRGEVTPQIIAGLNWLNRFGWPGARGAISRRCRWSSTHSWPALMDAMKQAELVIETDRVDGDRVTVPTTLGLDVFLCSAGFSDLSPEALALILRDCAAKAPDGGMRGYLPGHASAEADARGLGAQFWAERQRHMFKRFPPQTASLSDEGKVVLLAPGGGQ